MRFFGCGIVGRPTGFTPEPAGPEKGEIHDETGRALAGQLMSGVFIGIGLSILAAQIFTVEVEKPLLLGAFMVLGGSLFSWLSLKVLPDARTIAAFVEESRMIENAEGEQ